MSDNELRAPVEAGAQEEADNEVSAPISYEEVVSQARSRAGVIQERDTLRARVAQLEATLAELRKDVEIAAGECLVPVPEAGTALARVLIANRLIGYQRDEERAARLSAEQERDALWNAAKAIGLCACTVITGGAVARSPDCPLHSSLTEFAARRGAAP